MVRVSCKLTEQIEEFYSKIRHCSFHFLFFFIFFFLSPLLTWQKPLGEIKRYDIPTSWWGWNPRPRAPSSLRGTASVLRRWCTHWNAETLILLTHTHAPTGKLQTGVDWVWYPDDSRHHFINRIPLGRKTNRKGDIPGCTSGVNLFR